MQNITWLWTQWRGLTWWQMTLWVAYTIYFLVRSHSYWEETKNGLWKGYKYMIFGHAKYFRVYHVILILFDIPPAIVGLTFPALRKILAFKLYEFKPEKKNN